MFRNPDRTEAGTSTLEAVMAMALLAALAVIVESMVTSTIPRGANRHAELTTMAANVLADIRAATLYDGSVVDALVTKGSATRTQAVPGSTNVTATCTSTFTSLGSSGYANAVVVCADGNGASGQADGTLAPAAPTPGAVLAPMPAAT